MDKEASRAQISEGGGELTLRQREVIRLLTQGLTMKETGKLLHLKARTIAFHKYRVMAKLGLKTNSDLIKFALREGIIRAA